MCVLYRFILLVLMIIEVLLAVCDLPSPKWSCRTWMDKGFLNIQYFALFPVPPLNLDITGEMKRSSDESDADEDSFFDQDVPLKGTTNLKTFAKESRKTNMQAMMFEIGFSILHRYLREGGSSYM